MSQRWLQLLMIAGLGLVFFAPLVLHPTEVLYSDHSDLLAEHLPAKRFLVHSLHETGELPLWCPYTFSGSPFVHDIQVGMFYPLHWPLYLLPEEAVGPGLSWLIVLHVILAGWCMLAYARSQGLTGWGALVAASGYMFAGRWLLHVLAGGFYVLIALAWLPLVLLFLERAIARGSALWATVAGIFFALIILNTHPQWTFYSGVFVAVWTLGAALERAGFFTPAEPRSWNRTCTAVGAWLLCGSWVALVAVTLAAVQLLPTLEAAALSTRAAGVESSAAHGDGLQVLLFAIGPTLAHEPFNLEWEDRGGLGLLWVFAAALAPVLGRGRVRFQATVCVVLFLFAFGGSTLLQSLPGFRLFRQPARMLLVAGLPVALLAGSATQALFAAASQTPEVRRRCRRIFLRVVIGAVILCGGYALRRRWVEGQDLCFHVYWLTLVVTVPAAYWLLGRRQAGFALWFVLVVDLWGLAWPLVAVRTETEIYPTSACVSRLEELNPRQERVLDADAKNGEMGSPLGAGAPLALRNRLAAVRGYSPLDVMRYKEYLQFVADKDGTLRPFEDSLTFPAIRNVPIENKALLDLLGVRYLLQSAGPAPEGAGWHLLFTDTDPTAYDFIAGGVRQLGPCALYTNERALPRAFVVPHAAPLPDRADVLATLKSTDFRQMVWLEDWEAETERQAESESAQASLATVLDYQSNHVVVEVAAATPGWLVLTDVWYPGWTCTVNGESATVYRANYLFRAVCVPQGVGRVEFTFRPRSFERGKAISLLGMLGVAGVGGLSLARRVLRHRANGVRAKHKVHGV